MKIIHTSDLHLGSPLSARLKGAQASERRRELADSFSRTVSAAVNEGAAAVIIAGDLFDSKRVSRRTVSATLATIAAAEDIMFLYLPGNHEGDALLECGMDVPYNLKIFGNDWTYYTLGDVTFVGRSECAAGMFDELKLDSSRINIAVLHGEVRDRSERPSSIGLGEAAGKCIDYLALGHYHTYSKTALSDNAYAVYCGAPEGRGFDEVGDMGYVLIETDGKRVSHKFIKSAIRSIRIVSCDISSAKSQTDVERLSAVSLEGIPSSDLVRLVAVGGRDPELMIDTDSIERRFFDRFYYFEAKDSTRLEIRPEDYKNDRSLKGEFIRSVMSDDGLDEAMRERVIACGLHALLGESYFDR